MKVVKIALSVDAKKMLEDLQYNGSGLMREAIAFEREKLFPQ